MLLREMKLVDFRQFKGEQTVSFATDEEQNVTVIMGQNGSRPVWHTKNYLPVESC